MNYIKLEELEQMDHSQISIVDIRAEEDYRGGTFGNAINVPMKEFEEYLYRIPEGKPVYLLCHNGKHIEEYVEILEKKGMDVTVIEGGYRAWLCLQMDRFQEDEASVQEKIAQIEHSIIKKFRKPIWRKFTKAINDYQLIQEGDKIACCISGGKDSMLLAKLLQEIKRHGKIHFDIVFLVMNPGYADENWKIIQNNARIMGIPLTVFNSEIFDIVSDIDKNPCYLCARMRRGYLYSHAKELGCNKIALGHHFDDAIETILMGMFYGGKIETMMPKLHSQHFAGMQLIRPLYLVKEEDIKAWRDYNHLHFIQCACKFTESVATSSGEHASKRAEMKALIKMLRNTSDVIESNIFRSIHNINLRTVIGYHKDDWEYNFLDDYEKYARTEEEIEAEKKSRKSEILND